MLRFLKKVASAMGFQRADLPDQPPPDFRDPTPPSGVKVVYFDRQPELEAWARQNNISQGSAFGTRRFWGGYAPAIKTAGLLRPGVMRDDAWDQRVAEHEIGGHANGLVHQPGTDKGWGYLGPDGHWTPVQTMAELSAVKASYAAKPFDWSHAFAKPAADPLVQALQAKPQPVTPQQPDPLLAAIQQAKNRPA